MAFALISHTGAGSSNGNGVTTAAIDTTGANLLVLVLSDYAAVGISTISDSKGNTWTARTSYTSGNVRVTIFYTQAPTVGTGHTFTATNAAAAFQSVGVLAFSGSASSPFDVENGATGSAETSQVTGSVTPSVNNELLVAGMANVSSVSNKTIDSSFTVDDTTNGDGTNNFGVGSAHKIQTTAGAENPTWSWTTAQNAAADIATFKAAAPLVAIPYQPQYLLAPVMAQ